MTEYVAGLCFDSAKRVVLIRKEKPAWQCGKLNGVGGKINPHELPVNAMRREFCEETGVKVHDWDKFCLLTHREGVWRVHFFVAHCDETVRNVFSATRERVVVNDAPYVFDRMIPNLSWLIPMALDNTIYRPVLVEDVTCYD